jgi:hypothetical protein
MRIHLDMLVTISQPRCEMVKVPLVLVGTIASSASVSTGGAYGFLSSSTVLSFVFLRSDRGDCGPRPGHCTPSTGTG